MAQEILERVKNSLLEDRSYGYIKQYIHMLDCFYIYCTAPVFPAKQEDCQTYHSQWEKPFLALCPPSLSVANVGHEEEALEKWAQVMNW